MAADTFGNAVATESEACNGYITSATRVGDAVDGDQLAVIHERSESDDASSAQSMGKMDGKVTLIYI